MKILGFPWVVWRRRAGDRDVSIALHYVTPLVCTLALTVVHLAGASIVTAVLLISALTLLAASAVWAWQMARHVRAERHLGARWVQAGDLMEEEFTLWNDSPLPLLWVEIGDHSNVPGYTASSVRALGGTSLMRWRQAGTASRRGEFHLGPWWLETSDPLGLFTVRVSYPQARPLLVYPPLTNLPFPPLPRGAAPGASRVNRASLSPTVNAGQVRPYERGDPFHHIHWPSTARRNELIVKMFDQEASAHVYVLVDTHPAVQAGQGATSTEDVAVLVAASLAADLLREGRAVGLITQLALASRVGRRIIWPGRGTGHLWTILGELARLPGPEDRLALEGAPDVPSNFSLAQALEQVGRMVRSGANLVIVTPSGDAAWVAGLTRLAWRGISPAVVLIDPATGGQPTRTALTAVLAGQALPSRCVRCDAPLPVRPALGKTRRWEFKTLATGRVVMTMGSVR